MTLFPISAFLRCLRATSNEAYVYIYMYVCTYVRIYIIYICTYIYVCIYSGYKNHRDSYVSIGETLENRSVDLRRVARFLPPASVD